MNEIELAANPMATQRIVQDLNADPRLPLADASVDGLLCCVSVNYLIRPVEVLTEAAHCAIIGEYLRLTGGFTRAQATLRTPGAGYRGDQLYAVIGHRKP